MGLHNKKIVTSSLNLFDISLIDLVVHLRKRMRCSSVSLTTWDTQCRENQSCAAHRKHKEKPLHSNGSNQIILAPSHTSYFNLFVLSYLFAVGFSLLKLISSQLTGSQIPAPDFFTDFFFCLKSSAFPFGMRSLVFVRPLLVCKASAKHTLLGVRWGGTLGRWQYSFQFTLLIQNGGSYPPSSCWEKNAGRVRERQ